MHEDVAILNSVISVGIFKIFVETLLFQFFKDCNDTPRHMRRFQQAITLLYVQCCCYKASIQQEVPHKVYDAE